tara:strand:+ start:53751 stop:54974 length:1224 start_codon:yes stop_codon:yes gene_type:complete
VNQNKLKILYLTRTGLLEPLGQSQVLNYMRGLSKDYIINVISYEKPEDFSDKVSMDNVKSDCEAHQIRWLPQLFQTKRSFFVFVVNFLKMIWIVRREVRQEGINLIHARSYIPAFVALIANKLTSVPFIFDMRALWPEELINSGRIKRRSFLHRFILIVERLCLLKSVAVVSLTNAAINYLKSVYPYEMKDKNIVVIPTCANLNKFIPINNSNYHKTHGCIGTVLSSWFLKDWLANWFQVVAMHDPNASFEIVTRDLAKNVRAIIDPTNKLEKRLNIYSQQSEEMPSVLQRHDLSIMFFTKGLSKLGSAPTRMAEALGCGLPIVVNEGVGDVADIVRKYNVGIVVEEGTKEHMKKAFESFLILLKDPELNDRCRNTAEILFSLDYGIKSYDKIYKSVIPGNDKSCVA